MKPYARIVVAVDLGDHTPAVVQHALAIAERFGASLELIYCLLVPTFPDATGLLTPQSPDMIDAARADAQQRLNGLLTAEQTRRFRAHGLVLVGDPLTEIVGHARRAQADLIVMGTHGRSGLTHMFLGSVAERVVRTAPCPVLTVR